MKCPVCIYLIGALALCAIAIAPFRVMANQRIGIFIGINEGYSREQPLQFAQSDAAKLKKVMEQYGNIQPKDSYLVTKPSLKQIKQVIALAQKRVRSSQPGQSTSLYFFFTGHGDSENLHIGNTAYPKSELLKTLKGVGASFVLTVLDACQTKAGYRNKGVSVTPKFDIDHAILEGPTGFITIQSTQSGAPAYESSNLQSSVFNHHLLTALRGAADDNKDQKVSLWEAYRYTYRETVHSSAQNSFVVQHPNFNMDFEDASELYMTDLSSADAVITLKSDVDSKYLLFSQPRGEMIAELLVPKGKLASIAVSNGRVLIHKRNLHGAYATEVSLPSGGHLTVNRNRFKRVKVDEYATKGSLTLHPNRFFAAYAFKSEWFYNGWRPLHGVQLGYSRLISKAVLTLFSEAIFSSYANANYNTQETTWGLYATGGYSHGFSRSSLDLAVGPAMQLMWQKRKLDDDSRLQDAGIEADTTIRNVTFAPGALVSLRWFATIYKRLDLFLSTSFICTFYKVDNGQNTEIRPRWQLGLDAGAGFHF